MTTVTCTDCRRLLVWEEPDEPDELIDWEEIDDGEGGVTHRCFACREKYLPEMTTRERARLGVAILDLLRELEEHTCPVLREHGLERHLADLEQAIGEMWRPLDPILWAGPNMVYAVAGEGTPADA